MSVALTSAQVEARTKTVTRRLGWRMLDVGDTLTLCLEGFPDWRAGEFLNFFTTSMCVDPDTEVTRIEWRYLEPTL